MIAYANLIRRYFKSTRPIVLGGVEASLRRIAHYDAWSDRVRRSVLIDAKADLLVYGMGERTVLEIAERLREGSPVTDVRGLCYLAAEPKAGTLELPSFEEAAADRAAFANMFLGFYGNQDPLTARGLSQRQDARWLIHNPPQPPLSSAEMDAVHGMDFARAVHPHDRRLGRVRAIETIRFAIPTHRGCYGECHFCAIAVHEGRTVSSRSEASILREAELIAALPDFKGYILDVGGPTANMYGFECIKKLRRGACPDRRCLFPVVCESLRPDHGRQLSLLRKLRRVPGVKQAIVASGIRPDLVLADRKQGIAYLREVVRHHTSGQMKIAPEHSEERVLACMGKPGRETLLPFRDLFRRLTAEAGKEQFLTYYLIAAHPGCGEADMEELRRFAARELAIQPEAGPALYAGPLHHLYTHVPHRTRPFQRQGALRRENGRRPGAAEENFGCENGASQVWNSRISTNEEGGRVMGKDKDVKKEAKKKPSKTLKEKKEAKKAKKAGKSGEI